jgi:hypothetical protein
VTRGLSERQFIVHIQKCLGTFVNNLWSKQLCHIVANLEDIAQ